jgi:hypothetical protein
MWGKNRKNKLKKCRKIQDCLTLCRQIGKGTYTRAFYQKNEGSVEAKQRPIKIGGRTIYNTWSP